MCHSRTYTQWTEEKKKLMAYGSQFQGIRKNAKNEKLYSNNDSAGCNNQEIEANRNNMSHVLSVHTDTNRSLLTINGVLFVFYPKKIQYVYWRQCYCSDMFLLCSWRVEKNRSILCVYIRLPMTNNASANKKKLNRKGKQKTTFPVKRIKNIIQILI